MKFSVSSDPRCNVIAKETRKLETWFYLNNIAKIIIVHSVIHMLDHRINVFHNESEKLCSLFLLESGAFQAFRRIIVYM